LQEDSEMKYRRFVTLTVVTCSVVLFALAGCAADTPNEQGPFSVVRQALVDELLQCRESVSDCVTGASGISEVLACRSEFETCMSTVTDAADAAVSDLAACQDAAVDCVTGASSASDVAECRDEFMACAEGLVPDVSQLPDVSDLPDLGDLPDAEAVVTCSQDLRDCVTGGGSVVECADQARECMGVELPVDVPDSLPDVTLPDVGAGAECMTSLADCVAGGGSVVDCADQARACAADALPDVQIPDVGLPIIDDLPDPVDVANGGIDCAQTLAGCVTGGGSVITCADEARACLTDQLPL
jgi:hypothetical protein